MSAESDVTEILGALVDFWNRRDLTSFSSLFLQDAEYVSGDGDWWRGREGIRQQLTARLSKGAAPGAVTVKDLRVRTVNPETALAHAGWEMMASGGSYSSRSGVLSLVVTRQEEEWRILSFHNTDRHKAQ